MTAWCECEHVDLEYVAVLGVPIVQCRTCKRKPHHFCKSCAPVEAKS